VSMRNNMLSHRYQAMSETSDPCALQCIGVCIGRRCCVWENERAWRSVAFVERGSFIVILTCNHECLV
jgi:hypothetical protein